MNKIFLLGVLLLFSLMGHAQVLPSIFYAPPSEQRAFCVQHKNADHWFELMSRKIRQDKIIQDSRGLKKNVMRNLLVTWSYAELLQLSQKSSDVEAKAVGLMGHVYANASHHLGRIVRYRYWDEVELDSTRSSIADQDKALITGGLLGRSIEAFPKLVAHRLMEHSLELYETLSWVLGATLLCGAEHSLDMVENYKCDFWGRCKVLPGLRGLGLQLEAFDYLKNALKTIQSRRLSSTEQLNEFALSFVVFEQFYLQHTMYNKLDIGAGASVGMLDAMRFIPFTGEKSLSFREWCRTESSCQGSSAKLSERTRFDQLLISKEITETKGSRPRMSLRQGHRMIEEVRRELLP